jgi:hypothetical protein
VCGRHLCIAFSFPSQCASFVTNPHVDIFRALRQPPTGCPGLGAPVTACRCECRCFASLMPPSLDVALALIPLKSTGLIAHARTPPPHTHTVAELTGDASPADDEESVSPELKKARDTTSKLHYQLYGASFWTVVYSRGCYWIIRMLVSTSAPPLTTLAFNGASHTGKLSNVPSPERLEEQQQQPHQHQHHPHRKWGHCPRWSSRTRPRPLISNKS